MPAFDALVRLLHRLTDPDPATRERAADETTDVAAGLDQTQSMAIANVLVVLSLWESVPSCREAQLNALAEINDRFSVPPSVLHPLARLREASLGPSESEHLQELGVE